MGIHINILKVTIFIIFYQNIFTAASEGDHSNEFLGCFHTCHFNNCTADNSIDTFLSNQSFFNKLLFWSCEDECKYECMWHATFIYLERGWTVPQFYGKWPFSRFLGLQEPASVIFSLLNFLAHFYNLRKFRRTVPSNAPFYELWHIYFLICMNAWIWSVVFHARDTPLSEKLDYFSAFSMVLASLLMLLLRTSGRNSKDRKTYICTGVLLFFAYHIWYLSSRRFDYGYNMKINVIVGLLNGFGWIWWTTTRKSYRPYMYWCNVTVVTLGMTMFLELLDFPPLFWTFDAHALWHLSTVVTPFLWFKFIEGDSFYLLQSSSHYILKKSA